MIARTWIMTCIYTLAILDTDIIFRDLIFEGCWIFLNIYRVNIV